MRFVAVAFYGCLLALLAVGLRDLLLGYEENRCSMTYMFEYPEYLRIQLPHRVSQRYPGYGLYLYGEGLYAQHSRSLKLSGVPVLFLPGNAGSYKQARSLGSIALRKAEDIDNGFHLNVFTIDFSEELVALYGGSLQRQTRFVHESIKAILRLYKDQDTPPRSVAVVGHSMGGIVARALFTLPKFSPHLVSLILTQASPHQGPVLPLDRHLLEFYSTVRRHWSSGTGDLRNVTVLSMGGGYRDYQVRSGLTALPCPPDDPNKLSLVSTAVPRTWVSTDHLSIVWCKELVLATVRAFFDLIDPDTRQMTEDPARRMAVLRHHFVRHPVRLLAEQDDTVVTFPGSPELWTEVHTPRLSYSSPKEPRARYFIFPLSSRRKSHSHFHCQNSNLEMTSWLFGCTQSNGSMCLQAVDLSWDTELLPAYKVVTVKLSDLPSFSHLVLSTSSLNGGQFSVECEWFSEDSRTASVPVPHILSFGMSIREVTLSSPALFHTVELLDFHQVYQAFKVTIESQCKGTRGRLPSVYRLQVPWFREDSFTAASVPSVTEIFAKLHTSRPDNSSSAILQLHTSPDCQYKVSVQTSFFQVLGQHCAILDREGAEDTEGHGLGTVENWLAGLQRVRGDTPSLGKRTRFCPASQLVPSGTPQLKIYPIGSWLRRASQIPPCTNSRPVMSSKLKGTVPCSSQIRVEEQFYRVGQAPCQRPRVLRFCGPVLPVYMAVCILLACEGQVYSLIHTGRPVELAEALGESTQLHRVELLVSLLHLLLRLSWFQAGWSALGLPLVDTLPLTALDHGVLESSEPLSPAEGWTRLVSLFLLLLGAAVAFWGGALFRLSLELLSWILSPLHRQPSIIQDSGHPLTRSRIILIVTLGLVAWATCGALALVAVYFLYLYKVMRLQMSERTLKHVLNLAPREKVREGGGSAGQGEAHPAGSNSLITVSALEKVQDNLQLHLSLSVLLTLPVMLSAPSLIHWLRSLRHSLQLNPDPCWPVVLPLIVSSTILMNSNTHTLCYSKLLVVICRLQLPVCVSMVTFSLMHLYRVTYFLSLSLALHALCCLI
ncbi:PGAP1 deacylase, partial [Atractosteus spatula]|nr:PGAP1 deacylase [Atractosteus spatula]